MIKNYFKIALRNLMKNSAFTFINITGLSLSVAFSLLLFFYIRHEQSYDSFNTKKNQLFRLEMSRTFASNNKEKKSLFSFLTKNDDVNNQLVFPLVVASRMKANFPEIKNIIRLADVGESLVKVNNKIYKEPHAIYVDNGFFSSLSYRLLEGNPKTVLNSVNNIVITKSLAEKYFGNKDAVGKSISLHSDSSHLFIVSGVVEDAPENSSLQYSMIVPIEADPGYESKMKQGFNTASHIYLIELADNSNYQTFETKMNKWVEDYYTKPYFSEYGKYFPDYDSKNYRWYLRPLTECHYNASAPWGHYTNAKSIYELTCLVVIILLIASLNYILLAISNAAARSQEIGIRKVLGAKRISVILQFWTETQLIVIISVIIGAVLMRLLLPAFNSVMSTEIHFSFFSWKETLIPVSVISLALGIIAGCYPAIFLSRMKPASIIKSFQTFKINPYFSKVMVVMQYTVCVILMFSAFVINRQMHFINQKDLGFDKEQVLMIKNPTYDPAFTRKLKEQLNTFAKSQPSIIASSGMNGGLDGEYNTNGFKLNGEQKWLKQLSVDYDYFKMLGIQFIQGRPFSRAIPSDTSKKIRPCVVNETLFAMLGKNAKLGTYNEDIRATIIGVVKDYNFETLEKKVEPQQHVLSSNYQQFFMFKVKAGDMQQTIARLQKEWKQITSDYPFEYTFLDESITKMYKVDMQWQKIIQAACFFAIFIACMGLFGLSSVNAINRTKEIGIRKVLGATIKDIVNLLSSNFIAMFLIAIAIATPFAYWIMDNWLQDFAYRIQLSWWISIVIGIVALVIAFTAVSFQAIKAARANPVKSLRTE